MALSPPHRGGVAPGILVMVRGGKWWLEMLGNVGTLWAGMKHCLEAALPSALSQSQGCASAEPLLTYVEDDQPQYARHRYRNEYRISPNNLSLLQKAIYSVSFILT